MGTSRYDGWMKRRSAQITVVGSGEASAAVIELAEKAGEVLGRLAGTIITGGRGGVMAAVSRGAKRTPTIVVGILPGEDLDGGNEYLDVVIPSGVGYARNSMNVLSADVVVAIGGSSGTLSELAYAWIYGKPVVALTGGGGWADRLAGHPVDERRTDVVDRAETIEEMGRLVSGHLSRLGLSGAPTG